MSGNLKEFTDVNFDAEVLKSGEAVLVDFWAPWCGPCRMLGPVIEELANAYAGRVKVGKLNTDENPNVPGRYGIMSIPTVILFKNGQVAGQMVGAQPKREFEKMIDANL